MRSGTASSRSARTVQNPSPLRGDRPRCGVSPGSSAMFGGSETLAGDVMPVIALEYHDVIRADARDASGFPGRAARAYKLLLADFEEHLRAVSDVAACRPTVYDLTDGFVDGTPVLLTFDDGG